VKESKDSYMNRDCKTAVKQEFESFQQLVWTGLEQRLGGFRYFFAIHLGRPGFMAYKHRYQQALYL
jgi:hypothetical protein